MHCTLCGTSGVGRGVCGGESFMAPVTSVNCAAVISDTAIYSNVPVSIVSPASLQAHP